MSTPTVTLKQGEAKPLVLTVRDANGALMDLTNADLLLGVKQNKADTSYLFSKATVDFDITQASTGVVSVMLTSADTETSGKFFGELKVSWGLSGIVEKSSDFILKIDAAVTT